MSDSLSDLEDRWREAGLAVRLNPPVYGEGLLAYEPVDGPKGLTMIHDAVFVFTEAGRWGAWWPSRERERPDPRYDTLTDVVDAVSSNNQWSIVLP